IPGVTTYSIPVSGLNTAAVTGLSVTLGLNDQQSVSNLAIILLAPNNDQITLVQNQTNAFGQAVNTQGLPSGNAIGINGFTTGATGKAGTYMGTTFTARAGRAIFGPNTNGQNGNSAGGGGLHRLFPGRGQSRGHAPLLFGQPDELHRARARRGRHQRQLDPQG